MILAFDTSSALTSVALVDGDRVVVEREHLDPRRHAEVLAPLFADVRERIELRTVEAIACGVGPGPYTGLRVGIAAALAVGAAWDLPVHGVCSLDAVAAAAMDEWPELGDGVHVALDARRSEIYWAGYDATLHRFVGPRVGPAAGVESELRAGAWAGHGALSQPSLFGRVLASADDLAGYPRAAWVARRAGTLLRAGEVARPATVALDAHGTDEGSTARSLDGAAILPARPLYLRRPDAMTPGGGR